MGEISAIPEGGMISGTIVSVADQVIKNQPSRSLVELYQAPSA